MIIFDWLTAGVGAAVYLMLGWTWADVYGRTCFRQPRSAGWYGVTVLFWPFSMLLARDEPE